MRTAPDRLAMTLFEVALSLGLVAFGVTSVMMLFPAGLKAQQLARFQVYASAKALEMIDAYNTTTTANPSLEGEAPNPWDVSTGRSNSAFDLERRLASYRFSILPLPLDIAKRLDSDGGEIAGILSEGGYIYYSQPRASTGFAEASLAVQPPNDAQRLVFAVTGYAQSNAVTVFPWKAWPYHIPFPSPPGHVTHAEEEIDFSEPPGAVTTYHGKRGILWEDTFDPDMRPVFYCSVGGTGYGYRDHQKNDNLESAKRYCQVALWYCARKLGATAAATYDPAVTTPLTDFGALDAEQRWKLVQSLRFLAHATTCLTAYATATELTTLPGLQIAGGFDPTASGTASAPFAVTTDKIRFLHESAMNLAMLFAACYPYDWAVPRPLERTIMMDHPLIEWDMFTTPLAGAIWQAPGGVSAESWKPIPAQPVSHPGRSLQYSNQDFLGTAATWATTGAAMPNANWGNPDHFTLTRPFTPDERCRQLVFWAVDWQGYEDCETAPSAPVDACRYPRGAPRNPKGAAPASFDDLMRRPQFFDWQQYIYRNPEKILAFTEPMDGKPTGFDSREYIIGPDGQDTGSGNEAHWVGAGNPHLDQLGQTTGGGAHAGNRTPDNRFLFSGLYGADRNYNLTLDRGPIPRSVRMRATSVARFNFYDLRAPAALR